MYFITSLCAKNIAGYTEAPAIIVPTVFEWEVSPIRIPIQTPAISAKVIIIGNVRIQVNTITIRNAQYGRTWYTLEIL